jgi:hypothetical protein
MIKKWITVYLKSGRRVIERGPCKRLGNPQPTAAADDVQFMRMGFNLDYRFDETVGDWILYPCRTVRIEVFSALPAGVTYADAVRYLRDYDEGRLGETDLGITPSNSGFPITIRVAQLEKFWNRVFKE